MRSLVVMPNWVGDSVMALPVLEALAGTEREIAILVRPHLAPLLSSQPSVSETLRRDDEQRHPIEALERGHFDEAVVLPNSFRSAWWTYRAAIPRRWGYSDRSPEGFLRRWLLRPSVARPSRRGRHQVEDYRALLAAMDVTAPEHWRPTLALPADRRAAGMRLLARANVTGDTPLIGLFPGAEFGPSKRWPWRRFADVARRLRSARPRSRQVILAGPSEVWLAVRVHEESGRIHPVVGPDLDLAQLASVVAHLDLLITNDSGPMHIAAALGVPCLALFGPTDPERTRPIGDAHEVLYRGRWCAPCFRRRCPLLHHRCMRDISAEEVAERAIEMLDARSS